MSAPPAGRPVYIITHEFPPKRGGIATFTAEMASAAAALGHSVEVWAQQASPDSGHASAAEYAVRRMPLPGTQDLSCQVRLAGELWRQRTRLRAATVYLPEPGPMLAMMSLQFFRSFQPARLLLTFHGSEILAFSRSPLRRWLAGRLIQRADRVSTLSRYTRDLLLGRFPEAGGKWVLTPGAIRSGFAIVPPTGPRPEREKLVVLTVGRLHPRKGQLATLAALQRLPSALRRRVEFRLVGTSPKGDYGERLRQAAAQEPELTVRFLGDVPDDELAGVYRDADIFALTSVPHGDSVEGFGLVYLEASAHGLPIVAHEIGGVAEAVRDGVTGLLAPPGDPARLTAAFERLLRDSELRRRLGDAGRTWAAHNSWRDAAAVLFNPA